MRWFAIHTRAHAEKQAAAHLRSQGFTTYLPCYAKRRSHARRIEMVQAPVFPRYLFIQMDEQSAPWRVVRSTVGVVDIVRLGERPAPVPAGIVEAIQAREGRDGLVCLARHAAFNKGERLRIAAGPFQGQTGLFEGAGDDERVVILLELLGRDIRVSLPAMDVARAA
jgi:transcriptional antiterminator RfaH